MLQRLLRAASAASLAIAATAVELPRTYEGALPAAEFAAAWGVDPALARHRFGGTDAFTVRQVGGSAPANILWPGEAWRVDAQIVNRDATPLRLAGRVVVVRYAVRTYPGDTAHIGLARIGERIGGAVAVDVPANGWTDLALTPPIDDAFGGYAVLLDLDGVGRVLVASGIRTFAPDVLRGRFPRLAMDMTDVAALARLGASPNRAEVGFKPPSDADFAEWYEHHAAWLRQLADARMTVCIEFGAGDESHPCQPLGRPRPWLDDDGRMLDGKRDCAWPPSQDGEFKALVARFLADFAWPKGPVTAVKLWNEPWEGVSISGWGADMLRYRAMYTALAEAVEAARADGAQVLVGGCDSSSNTFDKLFPDGSDAFLPRLDFLSIHYQGLGPATTVKKWVDRSPQRVLVWDTESWVANSDERVAPVLATMIAAGQDRVVGIESRDVVTTVDEEEVRTAAGGERRRVAQTWPVGAAVGAFQHLVGERRFAELLFPAGLPWIYSFAGRGDDAEDGTLVVVGDLAPSFGADDILHRSVRSLAENADRAALRARLAALAADAPERAEVQRELERPAAFAGCALTLPADARWAAYDAYGNTVPAADGRIALTLDDRGYYLRGDGRAGSFAALVAAVRAARIDGLQPVEVTLRDPTTALASSPTLRLRVANVLNRPLRAALRVTAEGLACTAPAAVELAAHEARDLAVTLVGAARDDNAYPVTVDVDCGADGVIHHEETIHVDLIARRTIAVDGDLADWAGVLPQTIVTSGRAAPTAMEAAWQPFKAFDRGEKNGLATAWIAADDDAFYFAAKIADTTPHPGMRRMATRDDDAFFYPEVATAADGAGTPTGFSARWTGQVEAEADGDVAFTTRSDDGVRLRIDGRLVIDDWTPHAAQDDTGVVHLARGRRYDLELEYFQGGGDCALQLFWQHGTDARAIIPAARLFAVRDAASPGGLTATFFRGTELRDAFATRVDATVDYGTFTGEVGAPDFGRAQAKRVELRWPAGVPRYSYRREPELPCGCAPNRDNVQIAFNVVPEADKPWYPAPPGVPRGFIRGWSSDYEYALNPIADAFGGGTELWRLRHPLMPDKHFYPRQPASPHDGAVTGGKLVIRRDGATRIVECAIPWAEIPHVKARRDAGEPVKFSFRVNDDAGVGCLELSRGRSCAKRGNSFKADWVEHWENEIEFGWER